MSNNLKKKNSWKRPRDFSQLPPPLLYRLKGWGGQFWRDPVKG